MSGNFIHSAYQIGQRVIGIVTFQKPIDVVSQKNAKFVTRIAKHLK